MEASYDLGHGRVSTFFRVVLPGVLSGVLAGSLLIHMGTNLATDFFDFTDGVQPGATLGGVIVLLPPSEGKAPKSDRNVNPSDHDST